MGAAQKSESQTSHKSSRRRFWDMQAKKGANLPNLFYRKGGRNVDGEMTSIFLNLGYFLHGAKKRGQFWD